MNTGSALARFTITLSQAVTEPVQVEWFTSDGTAKAGVDYAANKGTVLFAPGETSKAVDILVYGRAVGTEDRSFYVEMLPPANAILGASIGECIITVDASGSTPVTQIIVPTGPQGIQGKSAYQSYLDTTTDNPPMTEAEWVESLKGDPAEIAQEVAPLIDVGATVLTAEGTETLGKPDNTTVKAVARRVAYAAPAKIATVVLADGLNTLSPSDLSGDKVDFQTPNFVPMILRNGALFEPDWDVSEDGSITFSANAGDVLYAVNYGTATSNHILDDRYEPQMYKKLRSFEAGVYRAIQNANDLVRYDADGKWYQWLGSYPKNVPEGSSPGSTGGIGPTAWQEVKLLTVKQYGDDQFSKKTGKKIIYAEGYGVVDSTTVDSTASLQALIDANPQATIILPTNVAISAPIKYHSYTEIRGRNSDQSVVNMLTSFTGTDAFAPSDTAKYAIQYAKLSDLIIMDRAATAVGKGTDSTKRGVNLLGTFGVQIRRVSGVRIDRVITCSPGTIGVHQYTARPMIEEINGSNVNHIIKFEPATDNRTPYGDIFLSNIKTTGSCKYGVSIEDTDGLTWIGAVLFPDAQIRVSGGYINIAVAHPFEAKAKITDTGNSGESLLIPARAGGDKTYYVNISGLASNYAGRLRDNTTGEGDVVNQGAYGIKMVNVQVFNLNATINHPSMGGLHLVGCSNGIFNVATRNVNVQKLGSGSLPAGTYDSVHMESCTSVVGRVSDLSPAKNYTVFMDDACVGCMVDGTASAGATTGRFIRTPLNRNNMVTLNAEYASGYKVVRSGNPEYGVVTATLNSTAPSVTYGINNLVVEFNNTVDTQVTDIPSVLAYQTVIVNIRDNGATKLITEDNGGKFVFIGTTTNASGRGKSYLLYRDPDTLKLRQL